MPTSQPNRFRAGTPTGGRFVQRCTAEADVDLSEPGESFHAEQAPAAVPTAPRVRAADKPFDDAFIGGWTPDHIREHFYFDRMSEEQRHCQPIGRPFSITAETHRGVKGFRVSDVHQGSGASLRVASKRSATRVVKLIEAD